MRVFITGGTGLIGRHLIPALLKAGHIPVVLSRGLQGARRRLEVNGVLPPGLELVEGDPTRPGAWQSQVDGCDAIINLAGENIGEGRWTESRKRLILESRTLTAKHLTEAITSANRRPPVLISASAVGYYGDTGDRKVDEQGANGDDFPALVCLAWEAALKGVVSLGVRVVTLRIGLVMDPSGGPLGAVLPLFKLGLGGRVGTGQQGYPWVHPRDVVGLMLHCLGDSRASGVVNAVSPGGVDNATFTRVLSKVLGRPAFFAVPSVAIRVVLGEMGSLALTGQHVEPAAALSLGYPFQFTDLEMALRDLLPR